MFLLYAVIHEEKLSQLIQNQQINYEAQLRVWLGVVDLSGCLYGDTWFSAQSGLLCMVSLPLSLMTKITCEIPAECFCLIEEHSLWGAWGASDDAYVKVISSQLFSWDSSCNSITVLTSSFALDNLQSLQSPHFSICITLVL